MMTIAGDAFLPRSYPWARIFVDGPCDRARVTQAGHAATVGAVGSSALFGKEKL